MATKLRVKLGAIELDYEGEEQFLKDEIGVLLEGIARLHKEAGRSLPALDAAGDGPGDDDAKTVGTTASIAARLDVKDGAALILAACAHLTFVGKKSVIARKTLLDEMQSAAAYYKESYRKNLSSYLRSLMAQNKLNEPTRGNYALTAPEAAALRGKLGI